MAIKIAKQGTQGFYSRNLLTQPFSPTRDAFQAQTPTLSPTRDYFQANPGFSPTRATLQEGAVGVTLTPTVQHTYYNDAVSTLAATAKSKRRAVVNPFAAMSRRSRNPFIAEQVPSADLFGLNLAT